MTILSLMAAMALASHVTSRACLHAHIDAMYLEAAIRGGEFFSLDVATASFPTTATCVDFATAFYYYHVRCRAGRESSLELDGASRSATWGLEEGVMTVGMAHIFCLTGGWCCCYALAQVHSQHQRGPVYRVPCEDHCPLCAAEVAERWYAGCASRSTQRTASNSCFRPTAATATGPSARAPTGAAAADYIYVLLDVVCGHRGVACILWLG